MTQPQTAPASRDAERTRTQILETATELFSKHGYEATALAQVSEAAGVARAPPQLLLRLQSWPLAGRPGPPEQSR